MNRRKIGICRRLQRQLVPHAARFPMSSFPYSPPSMPSRKTLADMAMFYASAELRERLMTPWPEDAELLEDLVEEVIGFAATWEPTTQWHLMSVVRPGRTLEWMVWQVATATDDDLGAMYRNDAIIPFAIDMNTLPRYPLLPTMLVHPDDVD